MELTLTGNVVYYLLLIVNAIGMVFAIRNLFIVQRANEWTTRKILIIFLDILVIFSGILLLMGGKSWYYEFLCTFFPAELRGSSSII